MTETASWSAMPTDKTILILGGTAEARDLADRLTGRSGFRVITSLAGRTKSVAALSGEIRSGGFGGAEGLANYLSSETISLVIDATHPFAATISTHAFEACVDTNTPRITLTRPPWPLPEGGGWQEVANLTAAAETLPGLASRVFVTTGQRGLEAFTGMDDIHFLVRLIEMPADPLPLTDYRVITARPPHDLDTERALLSQHRIDCLVSKNSGGAATEAKITAALEASIPIVLIQRPAPPPGDCADSVDDCVAWIEEKL